ncbi:Na/Pi-cotransporter II-related protein [Anaerobiospirillum thomasii]|uniref:Na/Pi cotransporter family protein n=1 Tax=Anaerobiospirillum thomasii TaxID=179995 RepID=UPI000D9893D5|nr:Na/Pi cotransporter family protein [Anaerobiospirillum thomasii]SPT68478.1 Na/Pi-cotransporter II-related protein [Anaerobiospirillum thomasii]
MLTLLNLISGVAMLSWGIYMTKSGMLRTFGDKINVFLSKSLTSRLWMLNSMFSGVAITALVQSSNATAMLVSSFLSKNLIALTPSLVIMLGANVGSALMARILTFDLSFLCPVLLSVGIFLFLSRRQSKVGKAGRILIGLGIILLALEIIVSTTRPIAQSNTMQLILSSLSGEFTICIIFGALLAIICYSSLAAVILTSSLCAAQSLDLLSALFLVIGANLGSCALEILGSLSQGTGAKRVMLGNFLFKATLALIYIVLLQSSDFYRLDMDESQEVIWFHVTFNLSALALMLPLSSLYAKALMHLIADVKIQSIDETEPVYLDTGALGNAPLARINAIKEILRLGGFLHEMLQLFELSLTGKTGHSQRIEQRAHVIEMLSIKVRQYLNAIDDGVMSHDEGYYQTVGALISCIQGSDLIKRMQSDVSFLNHSRDHNFSAYARSDLIKLCKNANENLAVALNALMTGSDEYVSQLMQSKIKYRKMTEKYTIRQMNAQTQESDGADISAIVVGIIGDLRQLNAIFCAIGKKSGAMASAPESDTAMLSDLS